MKTNNTAKRKHRAIVLINIEVHEVDDNNECTAHIVNRNELNKFNIKPKRVYALEGFDRTDCLKKLKHILDQFNA